MRWFKTFSLVIRSNITALFERFENPERVLNQLVLDMEEELEQVRAKVAGVFADEIQLGKQVDKAREEAREWRARAAKALKRGDEQNARAALEQKVLADQRAQTLDEEYKKHAGETAKLHRSVRDLEHKIRQARHRRSLLVARMARADSSRTVNDVLKRADCTSAIAQFQRLEKRVERAEAMEEAYDRLEGRDPNAEELARQFEEQERKEKLQRELDELKRRLEEEG
jgi:phage shock protein A